MGIWNKFLKRFGFTKKTEPTSKQQYSTVIEVPELGLTSFDVDSIDAITQDGSVSMTFIYYDNNPAPMGVLAPLKKGGHYVPKNN